MVRDLVWFPWTDSVQLALKWKLPGVEDQSNSKSTNMFRWLVLSTIYYHCFKLRNSPECTNNGVKVEEQGIWEWHMVRSFRTTGRCKLPFCNKIWVFGIWVHSPYRDRELTSLCPIVEDFGSWRGRIHQLHAIKLTGRLPPLAAVLLRSAGSWRRFQSIAALSHYQLLGVIRS